MTWFDIIKNPTRKVGVRQRPKDIEAGEPFDRARFNYRGRPDDAANRGGEVDFNNPTQESLDSLNYRTHFGSFFGAINRMVPKHELYSTRDKKNSSKHKGWAETLRNYQREVKQMILDAEAGEKSGN